MVEAVRIHPLAGRLHAGNGVSLEPAAETGRTNLRADAAGVAAVEKALGLQLPVKPKSSAGNKETSALWLGPDEWLVITGNPALQGKLEALGNDTCSAVDISHRNTAILVSGPKARLALMSGCPQDLRDTAFPVGACSRTILGKSEIVLWREADDRYRVECWRSFSDYVWKYLVDAAKSA
ncbi:MAG: sarcosine oxidase subunit gamma [Nitratireductor sp.]|nr:sarcosine oxidase subunit gamma [Nitratireductor sp.]